MEIEAKFAITSALDPAQIDALRFPRYALRGAGVERHSDVLLDTAERLVTNTQHAMRIRTIGARRVITVKGPNNGAGAVHARQEIEAEATDSVTYDPATWPPEVRAEALALTQGQPLEELLRVNVERRLWTVRRQGRLVGELALDVGEIHAAGRTEPINELELELKDAGTRDDLDALSLWLQDALPLRAESRSKLQRGLALLRHARWTYDGYTPLDAAIRHVVRVHLRSLLTAQRDVLEQGGDSDAIHDMRVATRRIRTTLQAVEGAGVFSDKRLESLRRRLSAVAKVLGAVRDVDIFLERMSAWVETDREREQALASLRSDLTEQRIAGYEHLIALLRKKKHARLIEDLLRFAGLTPDSAAESAESAGCVLTRHYAGTALWPRYEAVLRYENLLVDADPPTLHALRISCKRMRYAIEMFATPLGSGATPLRKALVAAQSVLGEIQDLTVLMGVVADRLDRDADDAGLRSFEHGLKDERAQLLTKVPTVWDGVNSRAARESFGAALAAL